MDNIVEMDYSLNPGRYVGFSIKIDENFDYQGRIKNIHDELDKLNSKSEKLMQVIQAMKL
jgi:type I restriction enzyme M protein